MVRFVKIRMFRIEMVRFMMLDLRKMFMIEVIRILIMFMIRKEF